MEPLLKVQGLSRSFGGLMAVQDVSFSVSEGQIMGVIGPNGAGKTTLFSLISGFLVPTRGQISFAGTDITSWPPHRRSWAGLVRTFQGVDVFPDETVLRNLLIACSARQKGGLLGVLVRVRSARQLRADTVKKVEELVEGAGLAPFRHHRAGSLPHAVRGKLGMAMALASSPRLLLLDEPLAGANETESNAILDLIEQARRDGTTVVLVDHNMRAMMKLCDRIMVLQYGKKLAEGTPAEIQQDQGVISAYLGSEDEQDAVS